MGTGDMIATMMAWLNTPKSGGGTGFIYSNREMLVGKLDQFLCLLNIGYKDYLDYFQNL